MNESWPAARKPDHNEEEDVTLAIGISRHHEDGIKRFTETLELDEDTRIILSTGEGVIEVTELIERVMARVDEWCSAEAETLPVATEELYQAIKEKSQELLEKMFLHSETIAASDAEVDDEQLRQGILEFIEMAELLMEETEDVDEEVTETLLHDNDNDLSFEDDEPSVPESREAYEPETIEAVDLDEKVRTFITSYPGGFAAFERAFEADFVSLIEASPAKPNVFGRMLGYRSSEASALHALGALTVGEVTELGALGNEAKLITFLTEHGITAESYTRWQETLTVWQGTGRIPFSPSDRFDVVARAAFIEHLKHTAN